MANAMTELAKEGKWQIVNVVDLGAMEGSCGICGHAIRYEYHVKRVHVDDRKDVERLVVGSSCGPKLVDISTWKAMNKAYVATTQVGLSPDTFKAIMARYVALRPRHAFMKSVNQVVQAGRKLSPAQLDVVEKVFSETDWEALETFEGMWGRIDACLRLVKSEKTRTMLESFKEWAGRKPLTANQLKVLESVEAQVKEART